ncbi:MAG: YcfL family protein [Opitutales bacterium]
MVQTFIKMLFLSFVLGVFLMLSCAEKGKVGTVSKKDPKDTRAVPDIKKVEFGAGLEKVLDVVRITQGKKAGDLLHIQVELKNTSSKEVNITHKLEWLDDDGFLVKDTSLVWKALMVRPGESQMIESVSTRPGVSAFRLKIQPAKNQ